MDNSNVIALNKEDVYTAPYDDEHDSFFIKETNDLQQMLSYARPSSEMSNSVYAEFLSRFIKPVFGDPDEHGNFTLIIPDKCDTNRDHPRVMYTSHHDTVHSKCEIIEDAIFYKPSKKPEDLLEEKKSQHRIKYPKSTTNTFHLNEKEKVQAIEFFIEEAEKIEVLEKKIYIDPKTNRMLKGSKISFNKIKISDPSKTNPSCFGADCTTGIWIMLQMIDNEIPGVYVIFNEEEIGRVGSTSMVRDYKNNPSEFKKKYKFDLDSLDICISFDRKGYTDFITRQSNKKCCSDEFANSMIDLLNEQISTKTSYPKIYKSQNGSFTDSYSFIDIIPECTNIPVGYFLQHTCNESQDMKFAYYMAKAMINIGHEIADPKGLIKIERDPSEVTTSSYGGNYNYSTVYGGNYSGSYSGPKENQKNNSKKNKSFKKNIKNSPNYDESLWMFDEEYDENLLRESIEEVFFGTYKSEDANYEIIMMQLMKQYPFFFVQFLKDNDIDEQDALESFIEYYYNT